MLNLHMIELHCDIEMEVGEKVKLQDYGTFQCVKDNLHSVCKLCAFKDYHKLCASFECRGFNRGDEQGVYFIKVKESEQQ